MLTADGRIDSKTAETLQARWEARHKGKRRIAVLGDGARFQPISVAPADAAFIDAQKLKPAAVCQLYGVPAGMMAGVELGGHEDYGSPEQRSTDVLLWTLRPWLYRIERAVSTLMPRTQRARFNAGGMVRATLLDRTPRTSSASRPVGGCAQR